MLWPGVVRGLWGLWHEWLVGSGLLQQPILEPPVRATTLLNRVLDLPGVRVAGVDLDEQAGGGSVVVDVALRRRVMACPVCSYITGRRYDRRDVDSSWRHLDVAGRPCRLRMRRRRLDSPAHGVVTEGVPFARPGARFTSDFETH